MLIGSYPLTGSVQTRRYCRTELQEQPESPRSLDGCDSLSRKSEALAGSRMSEAPADSSEIFDFRDAKNLRFLSMLLATLWCLSRETFLLASLRGLRLARAKLSLAPVRFTHGELADLRSLYSRLRRSYSRFSLTSFVPNRAPLTEASSRSPTERPLSFPP